jgi:hypothetical protein
MKRVQIGGNDGFETMSDEERSIRAVNARAYDGLKRNVVDKKRSAIQAMLLFS